MSAGGFIVAHFHCMIEFLTKLVLLKNCNGKKYSKIVS